mgnify:CR=1 FL=1
MKLGRKFWASMLIFGLIGQVAFARLGERAVERDAVGVRLGENAGKLLCGEVRPHRVRGGRTLADAV